jgi:hypothetical protein
MKYGSPEEVNKSILYNQFTIDPRELKGRIQEFLKTNSQVTLRSVVEKYPVNKDLVEIGSVANSLHCLHGRNICKR